MDELLPCPFCGRTSSEDNACQSAAVHGRAVKSPIGPAWQIECVCGAHGARQLLAVDAIQSWNTRATPPAPVEQDVERAKEALSEIRMTAGFQRLFDPAKEVDGALAGIIQAANRALDALTTLTPARAEGWLPIESAPKDGKPLDLWVYSPAFVVGGARSTDARWLDGAWREPVEWDDDGDQYEYFDGVGHTIRVETELCKATHWMRVNPPALGSVDHG